MRTHTCTANISFYAKNERDSRGRFLPQERYFEVKGTVEAFVPAVLHKAPEDCHPDEGGEVEILEVIEIKGKKQIEVPCDESILDELGIRGDAEEALTLQAEEDEENAQADYADRKYDEWRDRQMED